MLDRNDQDFFPELLLPAIQKHADTWASVMEHIDISLKSITLYQAPPQRFPGKKYLVLFRVHHIGGRSKMSDELREDIKKYREELQIPYIEDETSQCVSANGTSISKPDWLEQQEILDRAHSYLNDPDQQLKLFNGFLEVYEKAPPYDLIDCLRADWVFEFDIAFYYESNLSKKYYWILYKREQATHGEQPSGEPERPQKKYTALTSKAAKGRLNLISPAITEFCEKLKARIQGECQTLTNASADDWETQALSMLEDGGKWDGIITKDDIVKISFAKLAKSEHKERLKIELAQIVLEREGHGRINRKTLAGFVK